MAISPITTLRCRARRALLLPALAAAVTLAACSGPSIAVPPTPTPNPMAVPVTQNHTHGEGGPNNTRLVTRYGGPVTVALATTPEKPTPGSAFNITYSLQDAAGKPMTPDRLRITHERLMHLIVVSQDLTSFDHIHPLEKTDAPGAYSIDETVKTAGKYLLFNEFVTADGVTQLERNVISTEGGEEMDTPASLAPSLGTVQESAGVTAVMTTTSPKIRRKLPVHFVLDVKTPSGEPVSDLEPFLGAPCHIVIISADTKQFAHTHGDIPGGVMAGDMGNMDMATMAMPTPPAHFGPRLEFTHTFMQPGPYRIWIQFGHEGQLVTVAYNVVVEK